MKDKLWFLARGCVLIDGAVGAAMTLLQYKEITSYKIDMPTVILIAGWSGAGKDAVGKVIQHKWGCPLLAFAGALKEMVAKEYNFPLEWAETQEGKQRILPHGETVRQVLIRRGQEIRADHNDPGFFARIIANKITHFIKTTEFTTFVITDWRLPVELLTLEQELTSHGVTFRKVKVIRQGQTESPVADQTTEYQLTNYIFDVYIQNEGTDLTALEGQVVDKIAPHLYI